MNENFNIVTASTEHRPTAYIFYAGNMIPHSVTARVPQWATGGIVLSEVATLRHVNGYVRKCEITEMRQYMDAVARANIHPEARDRYISNFVLRADGQTINVGTRGYDSHLLFSPVYPSQELPRLVGKGIGVVEMPVSSPEEARSAQLFLFPDWDEYLAGTKQLPVKIRELKNYFISKRKEAASKPLFSGVLEAAILSCEQFEVTGREEIARQTEEYVAAEKKGVGWSYGLDAELYFEQLDIQRRDALVQQQSDKIDRLEEVLLKHAQALTAAVQAKTEPETPLPLPIAAKQASKKTEAATAESLKIPTTAKG